MIEIKTATVQDAGLIADISRETFYDTFAAQNTKEDMDQFLSEQFTREQLIAEVGKEGNNFLLAYENDQAAGYIFLKENTHRDLAGKNSMEISRLYVRASFIGKKIGQTLMQAAITFATEHKKELIWLAVWEHNHRAIQFYTRFGFEKFAEQEFILGSDIQHDWVMQKKLF